jgi:hypothetical protein
MRNRPKLAVGQPLQKAKPKVEEVNNIDPYNPLHPVALPFRLQEPDEPLIEEMLANVHIHFFFFEPVLVPNATMD